MKYSKVAYVFGAFGLVLACVLASDGIAGEFIPYELPSQRYPAAAQPPPSASPEPGSMSVVSTNIPEKTYQDFSNKVKGMPAKSKDELAIVFSARLEKAKNVNDFAKAEYYERLIQILRTH